MRLGSATSPGALARVRPRPVAAPAPGPRRPRPDRPGRRPAGRRRRDRGRGPRAGRQDRRPRHRAGRRPCRAVAGDATTTRSPGPAHDPPGPPHATSTDLLVLHALRCIGFAGLGRVAAAAGLPEPDVESELIDLAVAGLASHVAGDFGGWGLTEAGRAVDAERIAGELETAGTWNVVAAAYDGFFVLNPELLDLCQYAAATGRRCRDPERPQRLRLRRPSSTGSPTSTGVPRPSARTCRRRCSASALSRPAQAAPLPARVRRAGRRDRQHGVLPHRVVPAARGPARHPRHPTMTWIHPLAAETEESPDVLGGKARGLVVLLRLGLPVPQGSSSAPGHAAPSSLTRCPTGSMSSWRRPSPRSKPPSGGRRRCRSGPAGASRCPHDDHHPQPPGPAGGAGGRGGALVMGHVPRAQTYRELHGIPHHLGTAVTVQAMVFGNRDHHSGSVAFSRNPNTGERAPFGEVLFGRQATTSSRADPHPAPARAGRPGAGRAGRPPGRAAPGRGPLPRRVPPGVHLRGRRCGCCRCDCRPPATPRSASRPTSATRA